MATKPAVVDVDILSDKTYELNLIWKSGGTEVNLTGYSARTQFRTDRDATTTLLSGSSAGGEITLGGAAGTIDIKFTVAQVNTLPFTTSNKIVWSLEVTDPASDVTELVEGSAILVQAITR